MTSDAKIGLLLGLVFIVIIAFLINGLPSLLRASTEEESLQTVIAGFESDHPGLNDQASEAVKAINVMENFQQPYQSKKPTEEYLDVRFTTELPAKITVVAASKEQQQIRPVQKPVVESYTVQNGDNLATIAKKVYGPEQGNKNTVVKKLYQANNKLLDSPDKLVVGQKLIIPCFSAADQTQTNKNLAAILQKAKTFADKNFSAIKKVRKQSRPAEYIIKRGDTLWQIAEKFLGDGDRYHEIVGLNNDIIYDAEDISVGMRLKLPRN